MRIEYSAAGIFLPDIDLWLDPRGNVENAWLSHGHSDHARGSHHYVLGTPQTLEIYRLRWGGSLRPDVRFQPLAYGAAMHWRGALLTVYPAAHIVGAAQLCVEWKGQRLGYTGDIKYRPPLCGAATEVIRCDCLIMESTFGLPIFHTLSCDEARERIVRFARECLSEGDTPVFLGYPLGRGQEITHVLCEAGLPTVVHGAIARYIPVYDQAGYAFPGWEPYEAARCTGKAVVVPANFRTVLEASGKKFRIAYVSGWAALANARARMGAEELIPYSDHADFGELLTLARESGAQEIHLVHGYAEPLARYLSGLGYRATAPGELAAREISGEETEG